MVAHGARAAGAGAIRRVGELWRGGAGEVGMVPPQQQAWPPPAPEGRGGRQRRHWVLHPAVAHGELPAAAAVQGRHLHQQRQHARRRKVSRKW